ncbi:MAG: thiolase family protein [Acidimicrobiia bacterium]|nr:thiolase family protein [Acidimicrobiia bacterium]
MRMDAVVAGVGMTRFGKHPDRGLKDLGAEAVSAAVADAGLELGDLQAAYVGNCAAGTVTGQESIRGQVILHPLGIGRIPVVNVENACASGSTAFHLAAAMVTAGMYDTALALGVEKLTHPDKRVSFAAFAGAVDVEEVRALLDQLATPPGGGGAPGEEAAGKGGAGGGAGEKRSMFMDIYAHAARNHMARYGTTVEQLAAVAAKNSLHGSLNPRAQFREVLTVDDVLAAPMIVPPLTRPMCSPIGDGAAALVVTSAARARELGIRRPVRVATSVLRSGWDHGPDEPGTVELCAREAFEEAGLGPGDLDVAEVHDASAPAEIITYEQLGLCGRGEGGALAERGDTRLGGRLPVNTSGGLLRKGHPVGASGVAQIVELTEQLRGTSGERQVEGARVGLAQNGGGKKGNDAAAMCVTVLRS